MVFALGGCSVDARPGGAFDGASSPPDGGPAGATDSGGASGDGDSGTASTAGSDSSSEATTAGGSTGDPAGGATFGSGSAFDDVSQMFAYINEQRDGYQPHARWRGLPWTGSQHEVHTWPMHFTWDDALAAQAQVEADSVAAGAPPSGQPASDGLTPAIHVHGVDTARYMVSGPEPANSWGVENSSPLSREHGSARMAIFYHDPGGAGPVLTRLGIGAAAEANGSTRWVFVFE